MPLLSMIGSLSSQCWEERTCRIRTDADSQELFQNELLSNRGMLLALVTTRTKQKEKTHANDQKT